MLVWTSDFTHALVGGLLIGLATTLMMHFTGRVTGISGILGGLLSFAKEDADWRLSFISGLFLGGVAMSFLNPTGFIDTTTTTLPVLVIAGLFVGFGTRMGNGCTSGHGVCGVSRLSKRSIVATITFIITGALTVWLKSLLAH